MRCIAVVLFTVVAHTHAKDLTDPTADAQSSTDMFVDKLVNRATEVWAPQSRHLERTALGKPGHLATQPNIKISTRYVPGVRTRMPSIHHLPPKRQEPHQSDQVLRSHRIRVAAGAQRAQGTSASSVESTPTIFLDTDPSLVASRTGGRSAEQLIAIVKEALAYNNGVGLNPDSLASNFKFEGPVVGPLEKTTFVAALGNVDFAAAFPDWKGQFYGFNVDPIDGNRVWYFARGEGTHKGPFPGPMEATGRRVVNPPQACSMTINEEGLISRYTIGYVVDRSAGNTGGLGGLYGILYAIGRGLPFPEAQPWTPSLPYVLFQKLGRAVGGAVNSGKK